jgi:SAM-dependent methyltransferase
MAVAPYKLISFNACPVCSSRHLGTYRKATFQSDVLDANRIKITDSDYGKTWDLSSCRDCGHIFANPCPSPEYVFSLYTAVKDPQYEEEAAGRAKNFQRILRHLERFLPTRGALFDVGAATGILLHLARQRGWHPDGIEASAWAVRLAREKYQLDIRQGNFEEAGLNKDAYDALTMVDFIEHVPRPAEALSRARLALKPSGILCLVTPNLQSLAARLAGKKWWHFRPAHLAYFSSKSLSILLERAGFSILKKKNYSWTFSVHYLLSRRAFFEPLLRSSRISSFLRGIPIKLALRDSFEVYARKRNRG